MNNKTLGTLALAGAPFLGLGMTVEQLYKPLHDSWFTGIWGLLYISAWLCSITALRRLEVTGRSRFGKGILRVITATLVIANVSNVYQLLFPGEKTISYYVLDAFWPISNLIMVGVGITVIVVRGLPGWRLYVPLAAGLWFPFTALCMVLLGSWEAATPVSSLYTAVAWSVLALVVRTTKALQSAAEPLQQYQLG
jgi:hypothetical protein